MRLKPGNRFRSFNVNSRGRSTRRCARAERGRTMRAEAPAGLATTRAFARPGASVTAGLIRAAAADPCPGLLARTTSALEERPAAASRTALLNHSRTEPHRGTCPLSVPPRPSDAAVEVLLLEKRHGLSALALESLDVVLKLADVGIDLVDRFRSLALSGIGAAVRLIHLAFEALDPFPK